MKAKAKAKGASVSEVNPKNLDDMKAEMSHFDGIYFNHFFIVHFVILSGSLLKRELSAATSLALEMPQNNPIRNTLNQYKTRLEEYMDEPLG